MDGDLQESPLYPKTGFNHNAGAFDYPGQRVPCSVFHGSAQGL
jgi:hypothetical protein